MVDSPAVDVVAVVALVQDEHADVGDGAEVDKLLQLVLDEPVIHHAAEQPLGTMGATLLDGSSARPHASYMANYL